MLTKNEYDRVEQYLVEHFTMCQSQQDWINEVDNTIACCSFDNNCTRENREYLAQVAIVLKSHMDVLYHASCGCTPLMLEYQERYYQILILLKKIAGRDDTKELTMLCFASSLDLLWLQTDRDILLDKDLI